MHRGDCDGIRARDQHGLPANRRRASRWTRAANKMPPSRRNRSHPVRTKPQKSPRSKRASRPSRTHSWLTTLGGWQSSSDPDPHRGVSLPQARARGDENASGRGSASSWPTFSRPAELHPARPLRIADSGPCQFPQHGLSTLSEITDPVEVDLLAGLCRQGETDSITNQFGQILGRFHEPGGRSLSQDAPTSAPRRRREFVRKCPRPA